MVMGRCERAFRGTSRKAGDDGKEVETLLAQAAAVRSENGADADDELRQAEERLRAAEERLRKLELEDLEREQAAAASLLQQAKLQQARASEAQPEDEAADVARWAGAADDALAS